MKDIKKDVKKIFPKGEKYINIIIGIIFLLIILFFSLKQVEVGKYIKEQYGVEVYNIFVDSKIIKNISLKEDENGKYLWYIAEDSGRIDIQKNIDEKNITTYVINIIDYDNNKIQIYPFLELEKQNPNKLYEVVKVVDGDTIKIKFNDKQETIRLIGVDTPESVHSDSNKNIPEGEIASNYTKDRLEEKQIKLEFDVQTRDKYNRYLAYVFIDGKMFNKELLEKGYARISTYPPNVKYVDDFTKIQKEAIRKNKGFWDKNIWDKE